MNPQFIYPDWPAPTQIKALSTTRQGGHSLPPYDGFNLGIHVNDATDIVNKNRAELVKLARLPQPSYWLDQAHGTHVINSTTWHEDITADAMFSTTKHHVCTVMTADCLPILLCNRQGNTVAAIHAGWRGLAAGIVEKSIATFSCGIDDIMAWFGPAIGPTQFEVGSDVYHAFVQHTPQHHQAFEQTSATHYLANIYLLAKQRLNALGVHQIFGGDFCTASDPQRFFSYRRDGVTGRMASMIWVTPK